jgi:hypothetical protein
VVAETGGAERWTAFVTGSILRLDIGLAAATILEELQSQMESIAATS